MELLDFKLSRKSDLKVHFTSHISSQAVSLE